ncbi:MAG: hypothetical protein OER88_04590 [Planctomycetota bacterium]|nr:hypothetical protein [Planctomycetota bacterium]
MRLPVLCLCLAAAGCAGSKEQKEPVAVPPAERIVLEPKRTLPTAGAPRYTETKAPEWFDEEIVALEQMRRDGQLKPALDRAYGALDLNPSQRHRKALEALIQRVNADVLQMETLDGSLAAEREPLVFGDSVRIRVRLRNLSGKPIRIAGASSGRSASLFVLDVLRRDYDTRTQIVSVRKRVYRPVPRDVELEADGLSEFVLDLGVLDNDRGLDGFRTYTVTALLRPSVLDIGGLSRWDAIRLAPVTVRSFRPQYEQLLDDPVHRIGQAIEKNAPTHLLTAAALVPKERRRDAVDILVEQVRGDRFIDAAILSSLRYLTGVEFDRDATAWKAWWPRVREKFFDEAEREEKDTPEFGGGR